MNFERWDRRRLEWANYVDQNVIAHRAGLPSARFDEALPVAYDWDLILRLTALHQPLELPAIACLYSTTAANRGSDRPEQLDTLHALRARAHVGRPLRLLALDRHLVDEEDGRIDADLASLADHGAHITLAGAPIESSYADADADADADASRVVTAVAEHEPDIVLVYGVDAAAELADALEAGGRPFAVRVTEGGAVAEMAGPLLHPLSLGLWNVPEGPKAVSAAADFLDELADRLRTWKLDVSEV